MQRETHYDNADTAATDSTIGHRLGGRNCPRYDRMREAERQYRGTFGEALEQLMLRRDLWDTALSRRIGVTRSEVYRWRTGRTIPSRRSLERLQAALQWSARGDRVALTSAEWDNLLALTGHAIPSLDAMPGLRDRA